MKNVALPLWCCLFSPLAGNAADVEGRASLDIAIYSGFALVHDSRTLNVPEGESTLEFSGIPSQLQPETAMFNMPGVRVREQMFDSDILTEERLLEKAAGTMVKLYRADPNAPSDRIEDATLLSAANGVAILKIGGRIEILRGGLPGRIVFNALPGDVRLKPALSLKLDAGKAVKGVGELTYLTSGLGWSADYAATLSSDEQSMEIKGFAAIKNSSGADYRDARVQLVSGEVRRAASAPVPVMTMAASMRKESTPSPENFADYRLYNLPWRIDIPNQATKQVALLDAGKVAVSKQYRYEVPGFDTVSEAQSVDVALTFKNTKASGLGQPLPAGMFRVYALDSSGRPQFAGEDQLRALPEGGEARLDTGRDMDVTARPVLTSRREIEDGGVTSGFTADMTVKLRNAKVKPVTVAVEQAMPLRHKVISESIAHETPSADRILWRVSIPSGGETVLKYSVAVRYRDQ